MPDKRATLRQDTVRNDIAKALNGRQPQIASPSMSNAVMARKSLAGQIAKQNALRDGLYTPLGQSAKGSIWRGPDKPTDPKKLYRTV